MARPTTPTALRGQWRARRGFVLALVASLAIHLGLTLWSIAPPPSTDATPLQATITEMPAPPQPVAVAEKPKVKSKVKRARAAPPPPAPPSEPASVADEAPPALIEPTPEALAAGPEPPA